MDKITYKLRAQERDSILFNWKSESLKLPYNPEWWLTTHGSIGFLKNEHKFVVGTFNGILDEWGDFTTYVWHSMNTQNVKTGEAKNHDEIIVCGNTPLYRPFEKERDWYATLREETDKSIVCQLLLSRLNKAIVAGSDKQKEQIEKAFMAIKNGMPMIIVTSLLEELDSVDLTDNSDIERMQYLTSFYQTIDKRDANMMGIDLENMDKRAQVTSTEIKQYDDVTTLEYLVMFEARQRFMDEMKENGFDVEIVRNPVYFDEPKEEDIEEGTFEAAEPEPEQGQEPMNENQDNKEEEADGNKDD